MVGINLQKLKKQGSKYQKARLDHKHSRRIVKKDIIDNFNNYNANKELYKTSLMRLKTSAKRYKNSQVGYEKGIYTDSQMLDAKVDYLNTLFHAKNIMMDYIYSELTLEYLQNNLDTSSLRTINSYLVW